MEQQFPQATEFSFNKLLKQLVICAFPQTANADGKIIAFRCPHELTRLCKDIEHEAYHENRLKENSMLSAIDAAMKNSVKQLQAMSSQCVSNWFSHIPQTFIHATKVTLNATYYDFLGEAERFTNVNSGRWHTWLNRNKTPKQLFCLLRLLIYAIMHPEDGTEPPRRVAALYKSLLETYFSNGPLEDRNLDGHVCFHWESNTTPIMLTNGTKWLITTIMFLVLSFAFSADDQVALTEMRSRFREALISQIEKDSNYVNLFYNTQSEIVFYEEPFILKTEGKPFEPVEICTPPKEMPWKNASGFESPMRLCFVGPAACGKTQLFRAIGTVLTQETAPPHQKERIAELSRLLDLESMRGGTIIAMTAQQLIWYQENRPDEPQENLVDIFFRGTLYKNNVPASTQSMLMKSVIPVQMDEAHSKKSLFLLVDAYDELSGHPAEATFHRALDAFLRTYKNAHVFLFTRAVLNDQQSFLNRLRFKNVMLAAHTHLCNREEALMVPLMQKLHARNPDASLIETAEEYLLQIVRKDYDFPGKNTQFLQGIASDPGSVLRQLAWQLTRNPHTTVKKWLKQALSTDDDATVINFAVRSGLLQYDRNRDEIHFHNTPIQMLLSASHLNRQIQNNEDLTFLRKTIGQLPDPMNRDITFLLVHLAAKAEPMLTELLILDFACRDRTETHQDKAKQYLQIIQNGDYGFPPINNDTTLYHILHKLNIPSH